MAVQHVATLHRRDAGGRAGKDDVAGRQFEQAGEVSDHLRHLPDHLAEIALLTTLAVHLQPDGARPRVADLAGGNQLSAGRGLLEGLADRKSTRLTSSHKS